MDSVNDIMQLCRLCLVKDHVNIPIFDSNSDVKQTLLKINSCLPVKVSQDDKLPKKICDGCSYKLEMLYVFRNTSVNSEKQLLTWIQQATALSHASTITSLNSEMIVKQEQFEPQDSKNDEIITDEQDIGTDSEEYLLQEKLSYSDDYSSYNEAETNTSETKEPVKKKAKLRTESTLPTKSSIQTKGDNGNNSNNLNEATDDIGLTKAEDDSDESDGPPDEPEFLDVATAATDDQPGPSGVSKEPLVTSIPPKRYFIIAVKRSLHQEFKCEVCSRIYPTLEKLKKHKRLHRDPHVVCNWCGKKWKYLHELKKHIRQCHSNKALLVCDVCGKKFRHELSYKLHKDLHNGIYQFECQDCNVKFISKLGYLEHIKVQHEGHRYCCNLCDRSYRCRASYIQHLKTHQPNHKKQTYRCEHCKKVFSMIQSLKFHMKTHERDGRNFLCEICGSSFTSCTQMKNHFKTHFKEDKKFICEVCGKGFLLARYLRIHVKIHKNEKKFVCTICRKAFTQKSTLNVHLRYHTGERPFKCKICSKGFITSTLLKRHTCKQPLSDS